MRYRLALVLALGGPAAWAQPTQGPPPTPADADKPAEPQEPPKEPQPLEQQPPGKTIQQQLEDLRRELEAQHANAIATPNSESQPVTKPESHDTGLRFGSYGRVLAGTDLRGGKPEKILVVAHGPRIVEDSYLELDFSYGFEKDDIKLRPVITLAFDGTLFHDTGQFDAHPALRNMYLDASVTSHLSVWAGSRMYRGDDIYLFDYWPLDDLNTLGGGVFYRRDEGNPVSGGDAIELAAHAGVNRLDHPFQFQEIDVANPVQGATTVVQLNRQRMIASGSAAYLLDGGPGHLSIKGKLHGELHALPSGTRKRDDGTFEALPSDGGYLIGAEVSLFGFQPAGSKFQRHLNLFTRYAKGLAAFDELAPPTTFGPDLKTSNANELTFGVSGNYDHALGNVMLGILSRRFIDATGNANNPNNGWEYALDVRPLARLGRGFFAGGDLSYQARFPQGLNPITLRAEDPSVVQIAPMVVYSPMGPSGYDRPQLRLVYRAAHLNDGALDLYVPDDPRHGHPWVHFLGIEAEWWFNSTTYKR